VVPILAFWSSNMIVYWSGWTTVWKLMVAVLLGFVLLGVFSLLGQVHMPDLALPSGAVWLLPWLAGVTLISWLGKFPDPAAGNLGKLSFEWSAVAMLALTLLVYVLAYRFRLSPEEAARHIEQVEAEARVEEAELGAVD
jgi:hypothetical protein